MPPTPLPSARVHSASRARTHDHAFQVSLLLPRRAPHGIPGGTSPGALGTSAKVPRLVRRGSAAAIGLPAVTTLEM